MAAPKTNRTKEGHKKTIEKIQSTQLINALTDHILERNGRENMKPSQVTAALGLIKKTIPDLSAITMEAEIDVEMAITEIALVAPKQ